MEYKNKTFIIIKAYLHKGTFVALVLNNLFCLDKISNLAFLVSTSHKETRTCPVAAAPRDQGICKCLVVDAAVPRQYHYKR